MECGRQVFQVYQHPTSSVITYRKRKRGKKKLHTFLWRPGAENEGGKTGLSSEGEAEGEAPTHRGHEG